MRRRLAILSNWLRLPNRDGFADLDLQIAKLRSLRDSYQATAQNMQREQSDNGLVTENRNEHLVRYIRNQC